MLILIAAFTLHCSMFSKYYVTHPLVLEHETTLRRTTKIVEYQISANRLSLQISSVQMMVVVHCNSRWSMFDDIIRVLDITIDDTTLSSPARSLATE
jgi:hypothetical protein